MQIKIVHAPRLIDIGDIEEIFIRQALRRFICIQVGKRRHGRDNVAGVHVAIGVEIAQQPSRSTHGHHFTCGKNGGAVEALEMDLCDLRRRQPGIVDAENQLIVAGAA